MLPVLQNAFALGRGAVGSHRCHDHSHKAAGGGTLLPSGDSLGQSGASFGLTGTLRCRHATTSQPKLWRNALPGLAKLQNNWWQHRRTSTAHLGGR